MDEVMYIALEVEDRLQDAGCFVSGLDNRRTEMYSYMTCLDYGALAKVVPTLVRDYSQEQWEEAFSFWKHTGELSPVALLVRSFIQRYLSEDPL